MYYLYENKLTSNMIHVARNNETFFIYYLILQANNGPFQGKRVNRPVANFSQCLRLVSTYVNTRLHDDFHTVSDAIKKRPLYMEVCFHKNMNLLLLPFMCELYVVLIIIIIYILIISQGLLKERCVERGLSQPDKGGHVKMKQLHDSLRHACKVIIILCYKCINIIRFKSSYQIYFV